MDLRAISGGKIDLLGEGFAVGGERKRSMDFGLQNQMNVCAICKYMQPSLGLFGGGAALKSAMKLFIDMLSFKPLSHPKISFHQRQVLSQIPSKDRPH